MTKYIAALDLAQNSLEGRIQWRDKAAELDHDIRQYVWQPNVSNVEGLNAFLQAASGLWLSQLSFLRDAKTVELIHAAIDEGKRCYVEIGLNGLEVFNSFLEPFDLAGTRIGVSSVAPSEGLTHPRSIKIQHLTHPGAFRDPVLFDGVDSVVLSQAQVLDCRGVSSPVLSVPLADAQLTDLNTDLAKRLDATAVGVMGIGGSERRVLVSTGGLFFDSYVGMTGHHFKGIEENPRLARNVLRWLIGDKPGVSLADAELAWRFLDQIERTTAQYFRAMLARVHKDWWTDGVPVSVRVGCSERREIERNQLPSECYLDLIHWKEVGGANWEHIESDWRRVGWGGNKKAGLGWFDTLNEIRKLVMHPTKRAFGAAISPEQLDFLKNLAKQVEALASPAPA